MTRKEFINKTWGFILIPYLLFLFLMTRKHSKVSKQNEIRINNSMLDGISFHGEVICIKSGEELSVYSSKCTHLGCRINKSENGKLICPCHGSTFDKQGKSLKGPAVKKLTKLNYWVENESNEIIIQL